MNGASVSHNEVYNLPYSGITIGYGWGTKDIGDRQLDEQQFREHHQHQRPR
ncbi:hypothetical protein [Streptomyces canus]|uniref:hypothetical protein n=1 Tax=Streptomyces canus TaxID=58343 RepID=UPI00278501E5|nr:hypothetical protein [Streptomyces canus]MDQ0764879.1 hypothetical protein [Streptomyces canus]